MGAVAMQSMGLDGKGVRNLRINVQATIGAIYC